MKWNLPPPGLGLRGLWVVGAVRLKAWAQHCVEVLRLQPCVGAQALMAFPCWLCSSGRLCPTAVWEVSLKRKIMNEGD